MTNLEEKLIEIGNLLGRSGGHRQGCPKVSHAVPCTCGESARQAQALAAWDALMQRVKES